MIDEQKLNFLRSDFKDIQSEEDEGKAALCCMLFLIRYGEELFDTLDSLLKIARESEKFVAQRIVELEKGRRE